MKKIIFSAAFLISFAAHAGSDHTYNVRFSPVGLIVGGTYLNLDVKILPQWTVGPELGYYRFKIKSDAVYFNSDYKITAYSVGARANWFMNDAYNSGLYVGPTLRYMNVRLDTTDASGDVTGEMGGLYAACVVGYSWFWDSFNMMLGGGGTFGFGAKDVKVTQSNGTQTSVSTNNIAGFVLEFSLGWTF